MKQSLFAAVAAVSMFAGGSVLAADLPAKAPYYKAPPAYSSWTGCYLGAHIGAGWGTKAWRDEDDITFSSYNVNGLLGGGQVGCDYQFAHRVVIGVQGSFSGTNIKGEGPVNFSDEKSLESKINWIGTATARVGFTADSALIYVKGGGAWLR